MWPRRSSGDEAFGGALGVAADEVIAAGVGVGFAGLQHVPDGDEDRVRDGRGRAVSAAADPDPGVLGSEVGVFGP